MNAHQISQTDLQGQSQKNNNHQAPKNSSIKVKGFKSPQNDESKNRDEPMKNPHHHHDKKVNQNQSQGQRAT